MWQEVLIKDTHRGLYYENGVMLEVLGAGRYELPLPRGRSWLRRAYIKLRRQLRAEVVLVDLRNRDLTIKGQEILTADKVAIRVSILVQFAVTDPLAAIHRVANYEDRLYSDVQLAARRALAAMTLEDILTNRHRLSEEILREVKESATSYGVAIARADVKDLVFPGNLQEIMNRVLEAERMSQAHLVEARTKAEVERLESQARAESQRVLAQAESEAQRLRAEGDAAIARQAFEADMAALAERGRTAALYQEHPALLRLEELAAMRDLARNANARLYLDFQRQPPAPEEDGGRGPAKPPRAGG